METNQREAFEKWFIDNKFGGYKDSMWEAWEARGALASAPAVEAPRDVVERVAAAIDAVQLFARDVRGMEIADDGVTYQVCRYGKDGEPEIVVVKEYPYETGINQAIHSAVRLERAKAAIAALQPSATQADKPLLERIKDSADKFDALPEARKATMLKDAARPAGYVNDIHVVDLSEPIDKPHSYTITEAKAEGRKEGIEAAYDTLAKLEKTYSERGNTAAADILLVAGINVAALAEAPTAGEKE